MTRVAFLRPGDVENNPPGVIRRGGKVNMPAIFLDIGFKLVEVVIEIIQRMALDVAGQVTEFI